MGKYLGIFIISLLFSTSISAESVHNYQKGIKQMLLEYTVFGVDECLNQNFEAIVLKGDEMQRGQILVGSSEYFSFLSKCFKEQIATCKGSKCVARASMEKRLENIVHMQEQIKKFTR